MKTDAFKSADDRLIRHRTVLPGGEGEDKAIEILRGALEELRETHADRIEDGDFDLAVDARVVDHHE